MTEARPNVFLDDDGNEWVPARVGAALVPSTRAGKRTHPDTLHRLRRRGVLDGARRAGLPGWLYMVAQLRALGRVGRAAPGTLPPASPRQVRDQDRRTRELLADMARCRRKTGRATG